MTSPDLIIPAGTVCEWCDEAPATMLAYDTAWAPLKQNSMICEPCAQRAWERQQEDNFRRHHEG